MIKMTVWIVCSFLFLACIKNFANSANCDIKQISFPGLKELPSIQFQTGESFVPSCSKGYIPSQLYGKLTCVDGVWVGHFPPCKPDNCWLPPPPIPHGKVKAINGEHISKAEYECDEHHKLTGESTVRCFFGDWVGLPPICKDYRCKFSDLKMKSGVLATNDKLTLPGKNLSFQCEPGFVSSGAIPLCSSGLWVEFGMSPCKEYNCVIPDISKGKLMQAEEQKIFKWKKLRTESKTVFKKVKKDKHAQTGTKFQLVCDPKYTFEGKGLKSTTIECVKGVWVPIPVCQA